MGKEGGILYCIGEQQPLAQFWGITSSKIKKKNKKGPNIYGAVYPKFLCFTAPDYYHNDQVDIWREQNKFKKKQKKRKRTRKKSKKNKKRSRKQDSEEESDEEEEEEEEDEDKKDSKPPPRKASFIAITAEGSLEEYGDELELKCSHKNLTPIEFYCGSTVTFLIHKTLTISKEFKTLPSEQQMKKGQQQKSKSISTLGMQKWVFSHQLVQQLQKKEKQKKSKKRINAPSMSKIIAGATNLETKNCMLSPLIPPATLTYTTPLQLFYQFTKNVVKWKDPRPSYLLQQHNNNDNNVNNDNANDKHEMDQDDDDDQNKEEDEDDDDEDKMKWTNGSLINIFDVEASKTEYHCMQYNDYFNLEIGSRRQKKIESRWKQQIWKQKKSIFHVKDTKLLPYIVEKLSKSEKFIKIISDSYIFKYWGTLQYPKTFSDEKLYEWDWQLKENNDMTIDPNFFDGIKDTDDDNNNDNDNDNDNDEHVDKNHNNDRIFNDAMEKKYSCLFDDDINNNDNHDNSNSNNNNNNNNSNSSKHIVPKHDDFFFIVQQHEFLQFECSMETTAAFINICKNKFKSIMYVRKNRIYPVEIILNNWFNKKQFMDAINKYIDETQQNNDNQNTNQTRQYKPFVQSFTDIMDYSPQIEQNTNNHGFINIVTIKQYCFKYYKSKITDKSSEMYSFWHFIHTQGIFKSDNPPTYWLQPDDTQFIQSLRFIPDWTLKQMAVQIYLFQSVCWRRNDMTRFEEFIGDSRINTISKNIIKKIKLIIDFVQSYCNEIQQHHNQIESTTMSQDEDQHITMNDEHLFNEMFQ